MSRNLASWEKDPFFAAAEQVQDSADRLESTYRALIHARSLSSNIQGKGSLDFYRRELSTAFGIAKWQLEEFEKEVSVLALELHVDDNVRQRHQQFVEAINYQLSFIRDSLLSSEDHKDRKILSSISLGQKESDELAHFLCGSQMNRRNFVVDTPSCCSKSETRYNDIAMSASLFSTSSGVDGRKGMSGSLDECTSCQETCTSSNANDHGLSRQTWILEQNPVCTHADVDNHDGSGFATTAPSLEEHDDNVTSNERVQSMKGASLGAGSSYCNDAGDSRKLPKRLSRGFLTHMWPSFLTAGPRIGSGVSQSVLKRLKDGECEPLDLCQMCDDDIEANCSSFLCQRYKGGPELQTSRSLQRMLLTRQLIQKIIVALAVLVIFCVYLY